MTKGAANLEAIDVPIGSLSESSSNPRRSFGDMSDLAASVRRHGIMQPLLVRPKGAGYELIFGHRRLRAAKAVGLTAVPVMVRAMSDAEALERQLVENSQRVDIHPMEEAESYEKLHRDHGYSVVKIAESVGKSEAYAYARMKLLDLAPDARKAFYQGKLNPSTALLVARIKGERLQNRAVDEITRPDKHGEPMSFRAAAAHLKRRFSDARDGSDPEPKAKPARAPRQDAVREEARRLAMAKVVEALERRRAFDTADLRLMLMGLCALPASMPVLERRGYSSAEQAVTAVQRKLRPESMRGLLFELAVSDWVGDQSEGFTDNLKAMVKAFGLNVRELEKDAAGNLERSAAESLFKR